MIVRKFLETLNKQIPNYTKYNSFYDALKAGEKCKFQNKEHILSHFNNIKIGENEDKDLIILKYDTKLMMKQKWDDFYKVVRGLTVDWRTGELVLYPFDKFYELDETEATSLANVKKRYSNPNAIKEETVKIDGSLIIARYYKGKFIISSSGQLTGQHVDIARAIILNNEEQVKFIKDHSNYTIIYEMKNTKYQQLVKYNEDSVTVIGMRNMDNLNLLYRYEILELTKNYDIKVVEATNYLLDGILDIIDKHDVTNIEGFVLRIDSFMVKIKTTNYILANRFKGDVVRNFNMIIKAIAEDRIQYIRPLINNAYLQTYDLESNIFIRYKKEKEEIINSLFSEFDENLSEDEFIKQVSIKYPKCAELLTEKKKGILQPLSKEDITFLKKYSKYFGCVGHIKYSELNNIPLEIVKNDIKTGKLKYISKYPMRENKNEFIYIINKWQFIDLNEIHFKLNK